MDPIHGPGPTVLQCLDEGDQRRLELAPDHRIRRVLEQVAQVAATTSSFAIAGLAVVLSICAQSGDLFESLLKRRFGVKDSGHLIPGHGGLMDRLDGFLSASVAAVLIGLMRGGLEAPGRGLLVW